MYIIFYSPSLDYFEANTVPGIDPDRLRLTMSKHPYNLSQ